jgi:membrane protease YdiL (CAAX protease family)
MASFFVIAYLGSWVLWLPYILGPDGLGLEPGIELPKLLGSTELAGVLPGAYAGPLGAAFLVTLVAGGGPALLRWRHRLNRWRVGVKWYLLALVGTPALLMLGTLPLPGVLDDVRAPGAAVVATYVAMLPLQIVTSGLAEEPGWRDFALPILQYRYGPLRGTGMLGVLWAIWHFPLFATRWSYMGDRVGRPEWYGTIAVFTVMCVMISFFITWVFNRTNESLPLAMMLHASVNNTASVLLFAIFPALPMDLGLLPALIAFTAVGLAVLVATRGGLGYRRPEVGPELSVRLLPGG